MSVALVVPDPRFAPVPVGWCEMVAEPAIEAADSFDELDEIEGKLRAVMALVESVGRDSSEFLKAWRCVEARRGALLGPIRQGQRTDLEPPQCAVDVDASPQTQRNWKKIAEHWDDLREEVLRTDDPKKLSQTFLLKRIKEQFGEGPADIRVNASTEDIAGEGWSMLYGTAQERAQDIAAGSVDLILTDPPYPKDDLPLYGDLADLAARLLKPQGILLAYAGNLFLPDVLNLMGRSGLHYGWTFCLLMDEGSQSRIMGRHIVQGWKPVLAFSNGPWPSGEWLFDPIRNPDRQKEMYEWQQGTEPAKALVEQFSPIGGLVVDPFCGVASFGIAALDAGRKFVGVEVDSGRFAAGAERLRSHLAH